MTAAMITRKFLAHFWSRSSNNSFNNSPVSLTGGWMGRTSHTTHSRINTHHKNTVGKRKSRFRSQFLMGRVLFVTAATGVILTHENETERWEQSTLTATILPPKENTLTTNVTIWFCTCVALQPKGWWFESRSLPITCQSVPGQKPTPLVASASMNNNFSNTFGSSRCFRDHHRGTRLARFPVWDSNLRPPVYESNALPLNLKAELVLDKKYLTLSFKTTFTLVGWWYKNIMKVFQLSRLLLPWWFILMSTVHVEPAANISFYHVLQIFCKPGWNNEQIYRCLWIRRLWVTLTNWILGLHQKSTKSRTCFSATRCFPTSWEAVLSTCFHCLQPARPLKAHLVWPCKSTSSLNTKNHFSESIFSKPPTASSI